MCGKKIGIWNAGLLLLAAVTGWFLQGQVAQAQTPVAAAQYVPIITTPTLTPEDSSGNASTETFKGGSEFLGPIIFDPAGNAYFADSAQNVVWRLEVATNVVTRVVGTYGAACASGTASTTVASPACGDGGAAGSAQLNLPSSIAFDPQGNMYINDSGDYRIRKVVAPIATGLPNTAANWQNSTITTIVGSGMWPSSSGSTPACSPVGNLSPSSPNPLPQLGSGLTTAICGGTAIAVSPDGKYLYFSDKNHIERYTFSTDTVERYFGYANGGANSQGDGASAWVASATGVWANLSGPAAIAADSSGNVYFVDHTYHALRMISPSGIVSRVAGWTPFANGGGINGDTGDGGLASAASISAPEGITLDAAGNIYFTTVPGNFEQATGAADGTAAVTIRVINAKTGIISTVAGYAAAGSTGDSGPAMASLVHAYGIGVTPDGSKIYATDNSTHTIRVIYLNNGFPATPVGQSYTPSSTQDAGINVQAAAPVPAPSDFGSTVAPASTPVSTPQETITSYQVDAPSNGFSLGAPTGGQTPGWTASQQPPNAFVSPFTWTQVTATPASSWTAGACTVGGSMTANMLCTSAPITFAPTAPGLQTSRVVLTDGTGTNYYLGVYGIGQAGAAAFPTGTISAYAAASGTGVALDSAGNLYIADAASNTVSKVSGGVSTLIAAATGLRSPSSVTLDAAGNLYIADTGNHCIREVSATGVYTTVAGTCGNPGFAGDGSPAVETDSGSYLAGAAIVPALNTPSGIASDPNGNLYIADTKNNRIREVTAPHSTSDGNSTARGIVTLAGTGAAGNADGSVTSTTFNNPEGVAVDAAGNVYVADTGNNAIRKISAGVVSTIAGTGSAGYSGDGGAASAAALSAPTAVAVDAAGNIYVADSGNQVVRLITAAGNISTIAGAGASDYSTAAVVSTAVTLSSPSGIAVDAAGNYYIADTGNSRIAFVNAVQPTVSFGTSGIPVQTGNTATQTLTLLNAGNQPLNLSGLASTGATEFSQTPSGGVDCSSTTALAVGDSCTISITFAPTTDGTFSGAITITDDALNNTAATQTINLSGISATDGPPTAIDVVAGSGQTMNPLGAFSGPLQAQVADSAGHLIPGQSVTFTVIPGSATASFSNGTASISETTDSNGVATVPVSSLIAGGTGGTFTVNATVDSNQSISPAVFTEQVAGLTVPTVTITTTPTSGFTYGQIETVTVTLTAGAAGAATAAGGTVTLSDNGADVGTSQVANGAAAVTYTPGAGSHTLTASYSGDGNFAPANSASTAGPSVAQLALTGSLSASAPTTVPYGTSLTVLTGTLVGVLPADAGNVQLGVSVAATSAIPDPGTYALSGALTGSAAGNYTVTLTGTPSITITQANTTMTLTADNSQPNLGAAVTLTATVTSTVTGGPAPTGTVTFYNGTASLGTVNLSGGEAVLGLSTLPAGSLSITASYTGSIDYTQSASTAAPLTVVAPDFTFTTGFNTATVQQGGRVDVPITVTANQAFGAGTVTFGCSGLPDQSTCTFTPTSVALNVSSPTANTAGGIVSIAIAGSAPVSITAVNRTSKNAGIAFAAIFLPGIFLGGLIRRRRLYGVFRAFYPLFVLTIGLFVASVVSGCGGNFNAQNNVVTPKGLVAVQLTAQSGSISHGAAIAINVVAASRQ